MDNYGDVTLRAQSPRMLSRYRRRRVKWLSLLGYTDQTRESIVAWQKIGLSSMIVLFVGLNQLSTTAWSYNSYKTESFGASRKLLASNNSQTPAGHGPEWESCDFETATSSGAWVFSHAFCILIIFVAVAIVCDDFFVPSLEMISEKLQLSEDVAGATFMAAGSSAPELFTSVAGVAVETDVGVGTIVGSAVFNLLIIIALTAALAGQVLHLDWRPLLRDAFFYAMSIGCFIGFAWDGYFQHYEAIILLVLYSLYIILMVFNPRLMDWLATWQNCCGGKVEPSDEESVKDIPVENDDRKANIHQVHANGTATKTYDDTNQTIIEEPENGDIQKDTEEKKAEEPEEEKTINLCPCLPCCCPVRTWPPDSTTAKEEGGCLNWFKLIVRWILFIPAFPFVAIFSWTIPDCSKDHLRKFYLASFLLSVSWIAALSFGMVSLVGRVGCILGIDTYIMGLVVIAVGTSIPDALSSVLVARDGYGDMAVSNAIGSNVFDINLGLGLPFLIRIAIDLGEPISLLAGDEWAEFHSGHMPIVPHAKFGFILLLILAISLTIFVITKFKLTKYMGLSFVIMYVLFLVYAFTQELYCVRKLGIYC